MWKLNMMRMKEIAQYSSLHNQFLLQIYMN